MVTWGNTTTFGTATSSLSSTNTTAAAATTTTTSSGLFGNTSATPTPTSFGTTTANSNTMFGSTASNSSGGLFGNNNTSAFGTTTTTNSNSNSNSLFGNNNTAAAATQQQQQQQAEMQAQWNASKRQEASRLESSILALHSAYSPISMPTAATTSSALFGQPVAAAAPVTNPQCRFQHIFYDEMTPEQQRMLLQSQNNNYNNNNNSNPQSSLLSANNYNSMKPPHMDADTWSKAMARNPDPDNLIPVPIVGAEALHGRIASQQSKATMLSSYVTQLSEALVSLQESSSRSHDAIAAGCQQMKAIQKRLLALMRKLELCRCMHMPIQNAERNAMTKLLQLSKQVDTMHRILAQLEEQGDAHRHQQLRHPNNHKNTWLMQQQTEDMTNPSYREELFRVLSDQKQGLQSLHNIVKKDTRDIHILKQDLKKNTTTTTNMHHPISTTTTTDINPPHAVPTHSY